MTSTSSVGLAHPTDRSYDGGTGLATKASSARRTHAPRDAARIRVLFCVDNLQVGGTELNAVRVAEQMDRDRCALSVACLQTDGPLLERYRAANVEVHVFPISSLYGVGTVRQLVRFAALIRREQIDIVHAHDLYSNIFATLGGRMARVSGIVTSRRWWAEAGKESLYRVNRVAYRLADRVLANSPRVGNRLVEEGVPADRVAVVPNLVAPRAFSEPSAAELRSLREALGLRLEAVTIGIVANLRPVKDHATLLRAVSRLDPATTPFELVLIGDGECRPALEQLARDLGIADRVVFAGRRPPYPNWHHCFDISVLCSVSEGSSNSILEAMAAARPVVASAVGGNPDLVEDDVTGLLVPAGDPDRLAWSLRRLMRDTELRSRLGSAGRRKVASEYSPARAVSRLDRLYRDVLADGAGRRRDRSASPAMSD